MQMQKIDAGRQVISRWSGGTTTQLSIEPPGASYGERSFLWRLSSATVELPESEFTPLPDYQRILMILRGTLTLSHDGGERISLMEREPHRFDGASHTLSRGKVVDFNLMLRKGICEGSLQAKILAQGERWSGCYRESSVRSTYFVYCFQGCLTVCHPGCPDQSLEAGEGLQIDRKAGEEELSWRLDNPSEEKEAVVVIAEIFQK